MDNNYQNNQYDSLANNPFYSHTPNPYNNFNKNQFIQHQQNPLYTKIYLGQLPLEITENDLRIAFQEHCQTNQIRIVKGNAQGQFARYCYAFMNIKGNESFSNDVIRKVLQKYSNWKINIRADYEKIQNKIRPDFHNNQPTKYTNPQDNFHNPNTNYIPPLNFNNRTLGAYNQGEKGIKTHKILVREIWLGGIPEGITQHSMRQIMGYFGTIQSLQIFSKFAFIKYKLVNQTTNAFQKAATIHQRFGRSPGFRIFFSDPQKRTNIVSNHYQFDRQSQYLPILFLGFPPITSSFVDQVYMRTICQKYGPIIDTYMRKSNNPQTRSYILLTYDNLKNAIRAKQQLSRRRDLLGDKRVEVALLLQEDSILKGRNLEPTIQKFQSNNNYEKRPPKIQNNMNNNYNPTNFQQPPMPNNMYMPYQGYPPFNPNTRMPMNNPIGMNPPMMPYFPMMVDNNNMRNNYYYLPQNPQPQNYEQSDDVVKIIQSVLNNSKKQVNSRQIRDIYAPQNKGRDSKDIRGQEPSWSGFLIRNKSFRVGVDGFARTQNFNFEESMVNISLLIKLKDIKFKTKKHIMVIQPSNDTQKRNFEEYISLFKKKESAGVSLFYKEILLILPKCQQADQIQQTNENQLLVVMQDVSLYHQLKDKLQKVDQI